MRFSNPLFMVCVVAGLATAGCTAPVDDAEGASGTAEDPVTASNCQVFVDKVSIRRSSHGLAAYRIWLKTTNARLDGPVARVGLRATVHDARGTCRESHPVGLVNGCDDVGRWRDYFAQSFVGAADYFEMQLTLGHDFTFAHQFEGVFFVETTKGTRYWQKAADGGNFFLDFNGFDHVETALRQRGIFWWDADMGRLPKTADFYAYLNPRACR
jgi:hypothetical protein